MHPAALGSMASSYGYGYACMVAAMARLLLLLVDPQLA